MAEIRITKTKYEHVLNELFNIQNVLNESIDDLDDVQDNLTTFQSGRAVDAQTIKIQETKSGLDDFTNSEVANMIEIVGDLIHLIETNLRPKNPNNVIVIDTDKVKAKAKETLSMLGNNSNELKSIVKNSDVFNDKIRARHNELDDNFSEAFFNPIDEARQTKAEDIFRENEVVMDNINVYLAEELTFKNELDAIEDLIQKFDNFDNIFDPITKRLGQASLYDRFMDNTMGVANATSTIDEIKPVEYEKQYTVLNGIHRTLDIVGLWPGIIGMAADFINFAIYLIEFFVFDRPTFDDALYSIAGLIPGGKAGIKSAIKEAKEIGFNPIKLLANTDLNIQFAQEYLVDFGVIVSSLITNSDEGIDGGDVTISFVDNMEYWAAALASSLK